MRRFTIAPERIRDGRVFFDRDESRHLARVLRLRSGDTVLAADGAGHEYTVRLETIGDEATGTVLDVGANDHESPLRITLIQSVPKGDKMESIVRASTELGVTRIVPVLTARTIVTLEPGRWRDRARRWQRVAKEASKQCGRAVVPAVDVPHPLDEALDLSEDAALPRREPAPHPARRLASRYSHRTRRGTHVGRGGRRARAGVAGRRNRAADFANRDGGAGDRCRAAGTVR